MLAPSVLVQTPVQFPAHLVEVEWQGRLGQQTQKVLQYLLLSLEDLQNIVLKKSAHCST